MPIRDWCSRLVVTLLTAACFLALPVATAGLERSAAASPGQTQEAPDTVAQAQSRNAFVGAFLRAINKKHWDRVEEMVGPR